MNFAFYLSSTIAVLTTFLVITARHAVHALLYLVVSFLAVATIFFILGAPFVALLEVIVYAGAIVVLFVFIIMMLNLGPPGIAKEKSLLPPGTWIGPAVLTVLLALEMWYVLGSGIGNPAGPGGVVNPKQVGIALLDKYYLGVEMASMLLLASMVGAYHLGKRNLPEERTGEKD